VPTPSRIEWPRINTPRPGAAALSRAPTPYSARPQTKHRLRPQRSVSLLNRIIRMAIVSRNSVRVACTPATVVSTTEFAPDRVDRLADALVGTRQEADQRDVQNARVELLGPVVLRKGATLAVISPPTSARDGQKASRVTLPSLLGCVERTVAARAARAVDRYSCRVRRADPDRWIVVTVIKRLTDVPPGTVGFRAAGEIEREGLRRGDVACAPPRARGRRRAAHARRDRGPR